MLRSNFESEHLPIESLYSDPERLGIPGAPPSGLPPPDCPPGPPDDGDAEEDGDGGGGSGDIGAAGSTSGAALDYNQKETWVEVCKKMKETRIVPDRSGFKSKFSVSCKFLPMVKRSYPDAPFVIDEFGRVVIPAGFATASWKDPAYEAMKFVFGFETFDDNRSAKNEYGKSLGLCIPNFMPMDGAPPPSQTAMVPANPSSARREPISLLQDLPEAILAIIAETHDYYNDFYCRDQEEFYTRELGEGGVDHIPRIFVLGCVSRKVRGMLQSVRPIVTAEVWTQAAHMEQSGMWHVGELHLHRNDHLPPVQRFRKLHTIHVSLRDTSTADQQRQHLPNIASWVAQTGAPLRNLQLYAPHRHLPPVENLTDVSSFTIDGKRLRDISVVGSFPNLRSLTIGQCCDCLIDISAVALCPALRSITLQSIKRLADISPIANCPELQTLIIHNLPCLTDISAVAHLTRLRDVKLSACRRLMDISAFANCPELRTFNNVDMQQYPREADVKATICALWDAHVRKERADWEEFLDTLKAEALNA